ncbi:MAG: hypothetical protein PHD37_12360 [Gallionellaceae bacterium]|nr:hypothetical protein [Gallionellaceae bacterium]
MILMEALARPRKRGFVEMLVAMPDVGIDADFARDESASNSPAVFD